MDFLRLVKREFAVRRFIGLAGKDRAAACDSKQRVDEQLLAARALHFSCSFFLGASSNLPFLKAAGDMDVYTV
jgi:hypothetical protein